MKTRLTVLVLAATTVLGFGTLTGQAQLSFSAGVEIRAAADFNEPLAPYGSWVTAGSYGRCWRPTHVESGWRPYCIGHWEWTDVGWYWVSDEPWAWACYHYGGWVFDANYGWVWAPGTEWAPAWVTWREGSDYIGWAPCGPGGVALAPSLFVFVDLHHFRDHLRPSSVIINNTTIINRTKRVGDFRRETRSIDGSSRRLVINEGPGVDPIQKATGQKFNRVPVRDMIRQTPAPTTLRRGAPETGTTERSRAFPEAQPRAVVPERDREHSREQVAPERPPTPTGRENGYQKNEVKPQVKEQIKRPAPAPPVREERPPEGERGRGRDKENP